MRRFAPYIAVVLVYSMTPMAAEVTENLVHLATEGHLAHAAAEVGHAPDDVHPAADTHEHGCSPSFHLCGCHTAGFVVGETACLLPEALPEIPLVLARPERAPDGHPGRLLRPPIRLA